MLAARPISWVVNVQAVPPANGVDEPVLRPAEKEKRMAKVTATFTQEQADAVVAELGRMNVDGLKWRVDDPRNTGGGRGVPVVPVPANTTGSGASAGSGGPALAAPFFAAGAFDDATANDEETFLREAHDRGATLITVEAPDEVEEIVREIFERHSASNVTTK
jgi:hypothetical protein